MVHHEAPQYSALRIKRYFCSQFFTPYSDEEEGARNPPGLYSSRHRWTPLLPFSVPSPRLPSWLQSNYLYTRLPSTFHSDAESGLSSSTFNLADNIEAGDSRGGLDEEGKRQVQKIMRKKKIGFDEARRVWMQERFKKAGIAEDGLPRDPKFVSFS